MKKHKARNKRTYCKLTLRTYKESFYKDLEFGTGGMRGVMGVGTNRINKYTLRKKHTRS